MSVSCKRKNLLRPGLCSILKWDDEVVIIKSEPAAIVLISRVLADTEWKYHFQRVPIRRSFIPSLFEIKESAGA